MRTELLTYLTANLAGTIKPSTELPFEQGGSPNYLRNLRRVYLAEPEYTEEQLIPVLSGDDIQQKITKVRGYLVVGAKNRNTDLDAALSTLNTAARAANILDSFRKEFDYTSSINDDRVVYEFEYRFYSLT